MDLYKLTAHELHEKLVNKEVSSVELTNAVIARVDAVEDQVNSYVTLDKENALAQAAKVDAKIAAGEKIAPLAGIPGAIKDNISTKGLRTTCSSKMLENFIPVYDAHVIKNLRADETIFLGKTNLDEFAMGSTTKTSHFGVTHNPWNLARVPGGSSGGSAAAIAAGEAIWTLGSDTGGSIRQPASFNGCVGIKPTYGRVSRYGCVAFASSLDQIGPITKDVTDAALVLNTICGKDEMDSTSLDVEVPDFTKALVNDVKGLRIGLPKEMFGEGLSADVRKAAMNAAKTLERLGATVKEVSIPSLKVALPAYYVLSSAEASSNLARFDGVRYGHRAAEYADLEELYLKSRSEGFGAEVKRRILLGTYTLSAGYFDAYYKKALQVRTLVIRELNAVLKDVDCLLSPVAPTTAYKIGEKTMSPLEMYLGDIDTVPVNIAGIPGLSLPCGLDRAGLPVGVQLMGATFSEPLLYRVGYALEEALGEICKEATL